MKNETPVQSFDSGGVLNRLQVWKVVGLTLLVCGSLYGRQNITSFDVPGAAFSPLSLPLPPVNTVPTAINPAGVIVGIVSDASGVYHGFVRSRDGTYTVFDPSPDSTNTTTVTGINPEGTITGYYTDASGVNHGFLRASNGQITTIDDSGAGTSQFQGTFPLGINAAGAITGYYADSSFIYHGFVWIPGGGGTFTTIDPPLARFLRFLRTKP